MKYRICLIKNRDPRDEWRGYAIMPGDGTNGFLVGDMDCMRVLAKRLGRFLETDKHDGVISHLDERLGWQWMNITEAVEFSITHNIPVAAPTIRLACAQGKIADAKLDGKTWRFPRATFLGWLERGTHTRGRPREK
jgi:hypothetical protein